MHIGLQSFQRLGLITVAALQGLAVTLAADLAHATWHCTVVDGPGNSNSGGTSGPVQGSPAAYSYMGYAVPLYTRTAGSGFKIRDGIDTTFTCGNTDSFSLADLTAGTAPDIASPFVGGMTAIEAGGNTWFAKVFGDDIWAGFSTSGPVANTKIYDHNGNGWAAEGQPSIAYYQGVAYVFYHVYSAFTGKFQVRYNTYNTSTGTWSSFQVLDTTGDSVQSPTAVVFNGNLWVMYWDRTLGRLSGLQYNGSTWAAGGATGWFVDGDGGGWGQNTDHVGEFPIALVDDRVSPNVLHVFYWDNDSRYLRESYLPAGGTWHAQDVAFYQDQQWPAAPVLYNGIQVYWISNHQLWGAARSDTTGTGWSSPYLVDSGAGSTCSVDSGSGTSDSLIGPISAVSIGGAPLSCQQCTLAGCVTFTGPHLFYGDSTTNALREAFWGEY